MINVLILKINVLILKSVQKGLILRYHCVQEKLSLDQSCLNRGQCYLSWFNFANNCTQRGQYYVIKLFKNCSLDRSQCDVPTVV